MSGADETKSLSDEKLFQRFLAGDPRAAKELYRRWAPRLEALVRRVLFDLSGAEVAEAIQEIFLAVFLKGTGFKGANAQAFTWAFHVALSLCLDIRRKRLRRRGIARMVDLPDEEEGGAATMDTQVSVDLRLGAREELAQLTEFLMDPRNERWVRALLLKELDGLDRDEIAKALNLPRASVKDLLDRARKELNKYLEPLNDREYLEMKADPFVAAIWFSIEVEGLDLAAAAQRFRTEEANVVRALARARRLLSERTHG